MSSFCFAEMKGWRIISRVSMGYFWFVEVYFYGYTNVVEGIKNNANFTTVLWVCNRFRLQVDGVWETKTSVARLLEKR